MSVDFPRVYMCQPKLILKLKFHSYIIYTAFLLNVNPLKPVLADFG